MKNRARVQAMIVLWAHLLLLSAAANDAVLRADRDVVAVGETVYFTIETTPAPGFFVANLVPAASFEMTFRKAGVHPVNGMAQFAASGEEYALVDVATNPILVTVLAHEQAARRLPKMPSKTSPPIHRMEASQSPYPGAEDQSWTHVENNEAVFVHGEARTLALTAFASPQVAEFADDGPRWSVMPPSMGTLSRNRGGEVQFQFDSLFCSHRPRDGMITAEYNGHRETVLLSSICAGVCSMYRDWPLLDALWRSDYEYFDVLLKRQRNQANVATHKGVTALHLLAQHGGQRVPLTFLERLLKNSPDLDATTVGGWTPLHFAAWSGNEVVAQRLLTAGANAFIRDDRGRLPSELADECGEEKVMAVIQQHVEPAHWQTNRY